MNLNQAFPLIKQHQCWCDFTPRPWVMDHFRKQSKPGGTHCLTASFVIQNVPAAVSPELWDWTGLGLPLVPHDKGGRRWAVLLVCYTGCSQLNTDDWPEHNTAASHCGRESERGGRETLSSNSTAKETTETSPPNPQLCWERRPTKAFFAFSLKEEEEEEEVTILGARSFTWDTNSRRKAWRDGVSQQPDAVLSPLKRLPKGKQPEGL